MLRKFLSVALVAAIVSAIALSIAPDNAIAKVRHAAVVTAGVITGQRAILVVQGSRPKVLVSWTDTNTTAVYTLIHRKSTTSGDTIYRRIGYSRGGKITSFEDPYVLCSKTYKYRMRDSVSGQALPAWSDSAMVTTTCF